MNRAPGERFELGAWQLLIPSRARELYSDLRTVAENVIAALEGQRGAPFRRSRHATTWKLRVDQLGGIGTGNIFVKRLDAPRGLAARAKAKSRAPRSEHVLQISEDLRRLKFGVPDVLLIGENRVTGDEAIVMSEAPGFMLTRWMNPVQRTDVPLRRRILRAVGIETARLHLHGYIHGDLTPYNVFATGEPGIAITFIDHEGTEKTSRASINRARNRLRNLVQLGHFDLPGVSRTDKLRVFAGYAATIGLPKRAGRQTLVRLAKMLERRRVRDRSIKRGAPQPAIMAEEGTLRG